MVYSKSIRIYFQWPDHLYGQPEIKRGVRLVNMHKCPSVPSDLSECTRRAAPTPTHHCSPCTHTHTRACNTCVALTRTRIICRYKVCVCVFAWTWKMFSRTPASGWMFAWFACCARVLAILIGFARAPMINMIVRQAGFSIPINTACAHDHLLTRTVELGRTRHMDISSAWTLRCAADPHADDPTTRIGWQATGRLIVHAQVHIHTQKQLEPWYRYQMSRESSCCSQHQVDKRRRSVKTCLHARWYTFHTTCVEHKWLHFN